MAKTEIIGSWYNTGYHGHFRSKSRSDFINEYRHLAKPTPPKKFVGRAKEPIRVHTFSTHDNRNSFCDDALYFEQGLGKRRFKERKFGFKSDFLTWMPTKEELDRAGPKASIYRVNFIDANGPVKQQIVQRPKTSFDPGYETSTSYRYSHGLDNPNRDFLNAMSNTGLNTNQSRRQKASRISGRESVASCMSWYIPKPPTRPMIPQATQTVQSTSNEQTPAATQICVPETISTSMQTKGRTPAATQIYVPGMDTQSSLAPQLQSKTSTVAPVSMQMNPEPAE